jgi:hypothetical protein
MGHQFRIWVEWAGCPLPRSTRFTSKKPQATRAVPRTSCTQNCTAATPKVAAPPPPYTAPLWPSLPALSSALPCCCTRSEGRRPELRPLCLKVSKMSDSSSGTFVILFFWCCPMLLPPLLRFDSCELSCTEVDSHRYQYICQYIHAWKCQMTIGRSGRPGGWLIVLVIA